MEKKNNTFKIQFSWTIILLTVAVYILCVLGIAVSVWRIYKFGIHGFTDVIRYPFLIGVCVFCLAIVTAILIRSQYIVDGKYLITQYGFIKSKFEVKKITSLLFDGEIKKLTVKFGEEFMLLTVNPAWNENLVRALLEINPDISYSFTLASVPEEKKDEKKD